MAADRVVAPLFEEAAGIGRYKDSRQAATRRSIRPCPFIACAAFSIRFTKSAFINCPSPIKSTLVPSKRP